MGTGILQGAAGCSALIEANDLRINVNPEVVGSNPTLVNSLFNPKIIYKLTQSVSFVVNIDIIIFKRCKFIVNLWTLCFVLQKVPKSFIS